MESKYCSIAVHASISYHNAIEFEYKHTLFRYVPAEKHTDSDSLICRMNGLDFEGVFKKAYELFSAICFASSAKVILGDGIINQASLEIPIGKMNMHSREWRQISVQERFANIYAIALIRNADQEALLRLFRHAYSINDPFTKLLFYWHALVYPSSQEVDAVKFVNDNIPTLDKEAEAYLRELKTNPLFVPAGVIPDVGEYIRHGIRHSIAHIVRSQPDRKSLDMDQLGEIKHVYAAAYILEKLCRLRIERDFGVQIGNDPAILCVHSSRPEV